jgi:L-seryl-tRNA(Ser) seleniumtransferase
LIGGQVPPADPRRGLPRTDAVLADPRLDAATSRLGRPRVKRAVTEALQALRTAGEPADASSVADDVLRRLPGAATTMRAVINATGVVLHTNLGRAPLSRAAVSALSAAAGYVDVEFDLASGSRARRGRGTLAALHAAVPDAEAVHVVNNGAAALVLAALTLAAEREIVVSRGELVEIGDGFRLPDLIASTGARLREVGTTNRVALADYAAAIGPDTAFVLKVHPSNFRIEGFTRAVEVRDLATLGVPVVADVGSGLLAADPLLPHEPDVTSTLRAAASLVTCSGDKLLGGPQAGLILGTHEAIEPLRRHPLLRAVRLDKMSLAALEATLMLHRDAPERVPVRRMLGQTEATLQERAERLAALLGTGEVIGTEAFAGGGALPEERIPSRAVALLPSIGAEAAARRLRLYRPAVVGRIAEGRLLLDMLTVADEEVPAIVAALQAVLT